MMSFTAVASVPDSEEVLRTHSKKYLIIFGYAGSLMLPVGFLWLQLVGLLFVMVRGLLTEVPSLIVERRL